MKEKNIVLVGAGGFAKEVLGYLEYENSKGECFFIKGVIDDDESKSKQLPDRLPYLGTIKDYIPNEDELFLICIGSNPARNRVISVVLSKGGRIYSFISSLAYVSSDAKLGCGIFVAPFCIINSYAELGDYTLMNSYSAVGHDSKVGDNAILYPYAAINGDCNIGPDLVMGTRATIFPSITIGSNCTVTSHSYVKSNKNDNRFIHQKAKEIDLENRI